VRVPQTVFNVVEPSGIGSSSRRLTLISDVLPSEPECTSSHSLYSGDTAAPLLLIRFRKRWVAAFNLAATGVGILTRLGRKSGRVTGNQ
jgi:hypothetical protein